MVYISIYIYIYPLNPILIIKQPAVGPAPKTSSALGFASALDAGKPSRHLASPGLLFSRCAVTIKGDEKDLGFRAFNKFKASGFRV